MPPTPLALVLTAALLAHPGAVDSERGHFQDPGTRRGYHRHTSPLWNSSYAEAEVDAAERARVSGGAVPAAFTKPTGELTPEAGEDSPLRRLLAARRARHAAEARASGDERRAMLAGMARVASRQGRDLYLAPGLPLASGQLLGLYRVPAAGPPVLEGRARVTQVGEAPMARLLGRHGDPVLPRTAWVDPYYLSPARLGPRLAGLDDAEFARLLRSEPWKGLSLELFRAAWGEPRKERTVVAGHATEEVLEYPSEDQPEPDRRHPYWKRRRPVTKVDRYHFRNGRLYSWTRWRGDG